MLLEESTYLHSNQCDIKSKTLMTSPLKGYFICLDFTCGPNLKHTVKAAEMK